MSFDLAAIASQSKRVFNAVKLVAPFIISQTEAVSRRYAEHQMRLGVASAANDLMKGEVQLYLKMKEKLLTEYYSCDDTERLRKGSDLQEIERRINSIDVCSRAIPKIGTTFPSESSEQDSSDISGQWYERFRELASRQNEEWRKELLASALAEESANPGRISPKALWVIGILDELSFNALSKIYDIMIDTSGGPIVPTVKGKDISEVAVFGETSGILYGNLLYVIAQEGLIADMMSTQKSFRSNSRAIFEYGGKKVFITFKDAQYDMHGVIPTPLGHSLYRLYNKSPNTLGFDVFKSFVEEMRAKSFDVKELD